MNETKCFQGKTEGFHFIGVGDFFVFHWFNGALVVVFCCFLSFSVVVVVVAGGGGGGGGV